MYIHITVQVTYTVVEDGYPPRAKAQMSPSPPPQKCMILGLVAHHI